MLILLAAYRASQLLETLLDDGTIVPQESAELDKLYAELSPSSDSTAPPADPEQSALLLTRDAVPHIISAFELKESAGPDMLRAIEQARLRVRGEKA